ncbi:MAG: GrpB family protein [Candidatus Kariarchaeaceae archaeon]|jgi:GrpB-like predicted nucleotidyltransferase (UPF0157 family)
MGERAPIVIVEYDPKWPILFDKEKISIQGIIGDKIETIEHVGSTSVEGLGAKPIIDILISVKSLDIADQCIKPLIESGYEYIKRHERQLPQRRFFVVGPRKQGRTIHIHMVEVNSGFFREQIAFRDYLRKNIESAQAYYKLKKELEAKYRNDREKYTESKTDFILSILEKALAD